MVQNQSYDGIRSSRLFHDLLRLLQFLSAIISLGLFSHYLRQVHRRDRAVEQSTGRSIPTRASTGAVEGILAAATLYTLATLLLRCLLRRIRAPAFLRWLLMALDLAFMALFITVAVLTRPNGGPSGRHGALYCNIPRRLLSRPQSWLVKNGWCKLATGTFALAILSTILHFLTALFPEISEKRRAKADVAGYEMDNNARV
ncbi:MAG: hypothetical protein Q9221_003305 [Calogaya cf. arnoldii]